MTVRTLINSPNHYLATCPINMPLIDAVNEMVRRKENALCVVNSDGTLAGIITDHDIMLRLSKNNGQLGDGTVTDCMTHSVITCDCDTKLDVAFRMMGRHKIRHLVAVENGKPVSIIGIRAALAKIHEDDEMEINVLRDITTAKSA